MQQKSMDRQLTIYHTSQIMIATQHPFPTPSPLEVPSSAILPSSVPENAPEHCPVSTHQVIGGGADK
jgi:hypothetical protein